MRGSQGLLLRAVPGPTASCSSPAKGMVPWAEGIEPLKSMYSVAVFLQHRRGVSLKPYHR